ncbi:hypothetical protein [Thiolapillus sp.]|uniref:hypothetical protein n=1 Tax=Thiolapillus sp. TaxID=2017437 RepID=UPI00263AD49E|nr:hypothetical protein [Thiolapillus sp.]
MTRTSGAQIGCQRPSRFWGLGCPKIYHEAEDTLDSFPSFRIRITIVSNLFQLALEVILVLSAVSAVQEKQ